VAKKTVKRSATKKAASKPSKTAARPAAQAAKKPASKPAPAPAPKRAAAATPHAGLPLAERAQQLREEITRSKLTHPDPWRYADKARGWGERAQVIVEVIAVRGDTVSARTSLEALLAELDRDRDFQEARRLF
jgi:hypothetical protein